MNSPKQKINEENRLSEGLSPLIYASLCDSMDAATSEHLTLSIGIAKAPVIIAAFRFCSSYHSPSVSELLGLQYGLKKIMLPDLSTK